MVAPHSQPPSSMRPAAIGGRYRVLQQLGRGGMGEVYRVLDTSTSQTLALKLLRKSDPALVGQFEREFQLLAQLQHPHVIAVHNYGVDPAGPFYTMELLDGGDLRTLAPLDHRLACKLLFEVCSSLALLHSRRLVHRDVSPRNIRCTPTGHAKLIDFGTMTAMGPCANAAGTPGFVAPEVVQRAPLDARTDLFSLGATLYYALTGQAPFAQRGLVELAHMFEQEPPPPSALVPAIPPALDALCLALLRREPARRPQSAFEVMRRLEVVAGIEQHESAAVSRAYLTTPALVGRQEPLHAFGQRMRRALQGLGSALCLEGERGVGRSRLLETCALEAKLLGAKVVRAAAHGGGDTAFAVAQQLGEQLIEALPEAAAAAARIRGVHERLLIRDASGATRLRELADPALEPGALHAALFAWFAEVCAAHALCVVVDDVERRDPDSLALLAALAMQARDGHMLVVLTCQAVERAGSSALSLLAQHCSVVGVRALTRAETQSLLASIFGDVPQLVPISESLYKLALGNPRETLALTQHLVDTGAIRYQNGQWALPPELDAEALPASVARALAVRVQTLPGLARRLLELQALLGADALGAAEYPKLLPDAPHEQVQEALELLCARELLQRDGDFYGLSHRALGETLARLLDDDERRERHWTLYQFYQRKNAHVLLCSHQLLEAGRVEDALDLLAHSPDNDAKVPEELVRADPERLAATLERALQLTLDSHRPAREAHELRRRLCELGILTDATLHQRFAPSWIAQVRRDSGLDDYEALPDSLEPGQRLQQALAATMARYAATAERDRVYNIQESIKSLCSYVVATMVVVSRTADNHLLAGVPDLLQPFAAIAPAVFAIWQNALALEESVCFGRLLAARQRWNDVYERLGALQDDVRLKMIRNAVAFGIGTLEASLGRSAAFTYADQLDDDPRQRVGAMHIRSLACAMLGDAAGVERYRREAALLAVRGSASPMFEAAWGVEYVVSAVTRDLAGLKRVIDSVSPLARRHPGWLPVLRTAEAQLQLLCGDAAGALLLFTEAQRLAAARDTSAGRVETWVNASAGACTALTSLQRFDDAIALGEQALARCAERGMQVLPHRIIVPLAIAEAKHGRVQQAARRIDALIPEQLELGVLGIALAASYEARAKIAIAARDIAAVRHFADLAQRARGSNARAFVEPLFEEARAAGLPVWGGEVSRGGERTAPRDQAAPLTAAALDACTSREQRAERALELICELAAADGGWLYLVDDAGELAIRATRQAPPPDAHALRFARGYFEQHIDDASIAEAFTQMTDELAAASYIDARGAQHHVLPLRCVHEDGLLYVGLAVLKANGRARVEPAQLGAIASSLARTGDSPGRRPPIDDV